MECFAQRAVLAPSFLKFFLAATILVAFIVPAVHAMPVPGQTAQPTLGGPLVEPAAQKCFRVNTNSLHLRLRPFKQAQIVGYASRGEILVKRRLCSWRGWCPVRQGELSAWAWKAHMTQIDC